MRTKPEELQTVLVTDCGSTTTKALLFEKTTDGWRKTSRGEAPTTVEEPVADVTVGALNAFSEIQEISGRQLLSETDPATPFLVQADTSKNGIDLYLSTSSAGGGLQMLVSGIVREITAESAQRAALGAGAIVLDVLSADDGREDHERIERIRHLKPDIMLLTGGVDGGSKTHPIDMAETILAAAPRPRFGETLKLPVIYAGNNAAADEVVAILENFAQVSVVENVRPSLETENLAPAREAIHELFLSHVMSHSPGYDKLLKWSPVPVMPTPAAVGDMILAYARRSNKQVLCADIGGATTDVFSVFKNRSDELVFNRTVSANYGMSYSIANVLIEAGVENLLRWLPYELKEHELRDRLRNKMIRPTSIPQTMEDLWLEQSVCREALRLSLEHHRSLAVGLSGKQQNRGIADIFSQTSNRYELVDLLKLDLVIGSGGVLSHAPNRAGAVLMMLDGFGLAGITEVAVDSIFMLPHLGVLASIHPAAAEEIFIKDCLEFLAHSIVPLSEARQQKQQILAVVKFAGQVVGEVRSGELEQLKLPVGTSGLLKVEPGSSSIDLGAGKGQVVEKEITVRQQGLFLDGRGRPLSNLKPTLAQQQDIYRKLGLDQL